ncbi:lysylphosphatidylglycerol synthase domain-containing protein [Pseudotamlana agarivorans]|uniref:lysylphosphatidylglycerol synthase domain-containing protein n=1 Tax=Pseudotamlana agarivorans TaxID=481183 RepID=UPI002936E432|nr:lysylphosphatidylglycerol synthase domain-containing protein [Tamlana agarivorans]
MDLICTIIAHTLPYRSKQRLFKLIKISIVLAALYFIYQKIVHNNTLHFSEFYNILSENNAFSVKTLSFLLILSIINWLFELFKWQLLLRPFKNISLKQACEQCLGSLTTSLITPNRIGEYGAKAMYYEASFRKHIVAINFINNILQLAVTTFVGLIGLWWFIQSYNTALNMEYLAIYGTILVLVISFIGWFIFKGNFKLKQVSTKKLRRFFKRFPIKTLYYGFGLSFLRYAVFSFQFYFLLQIFQIRLPYFEAISIIASMYLIASIIPSITLFDGLIKGSVSVYLFAFVGAHELIILSITMVMWMLNFMIPSLIGCFYVLNFKYNKTINS